MCLDPATLTLIATGVSAIGGFSGAISEANASADTDIRQIEEVNRTTNLQAEELDREKERESEKTSREMARVRRNQKRLIGTQVANFGSNGIQIDGSASDVIEDSLNESELDLSAIRFGNDTTRESINREKTQLFENAAFQSSQLRTRAKNTRRAGLIKGATKFAGAF